MKLNESNPSLTEAMAATQAAITNFQLMRRRMAVTMRKSGKTWREIGDALGVTRQRAKQMVQQETKSADESGVNLKP